MSASVPSHLCHVDTDARTDADADEPDHVFSNQGFPRRAQACRFGPRLGEPRLTASAPGRTSTEAQPLKRLGAPFGLRRIVAKAGTCPQTRTKSRIQSLSERNFLVSRHRHRDRPPLTPARWPPNAAFCPQRLHPELPRRNPRPQPRSMPPNQDQIRDSVLVWAKSPRFTTPAPRPTRLTPARWPPSAAFCPQRLHPELPRRNPRPQPRSMPPNQDQIQDSVLVWARSPRFTTPAPRPTSAHASPLKHRCRRPH